MRLKDHLKFPLFIFALFAGLGAAMAGGASNGGDRPYMVASANPHATDAGLEILARGGSAVDAAIAVQAVLGLVEPQSSGIGGGAFLLFHDQERGALTAYDGRETAPLAATEALFLKEDGTPEDKRDVIPGGRSAGVPGVLRMLALAHERHGKLPWEALFAPAIKLARDGFAISPRLHMLVSRDQGLPLFAASKAYFYDAAGAPLPVGHVLKNPAYAETLQTIARQGVQPFYEGAIAEAIVQAVQNAARNPGKLTREDMAAYTPKVREAVCTLYRQWRICGMPPPSSGGIAVAQILKLLEGFDLTQAPPNSPRAVNLFAEAARLAYADRATHLGDSDFVPVPVAGLISASYLEARRQLITPGAMMPQAPAGQPPGAGTAFRTVQPGEIPATSHFSVVDSAGNTLAMTTSVESAFGNRMLVNGFLLNNQLTDFSFAPEAGGAPVANRVEGGKRPLSSMSPTIVFDHQGRPVITVGSPGGPLIIAFVAKTLIGVLDWGLPLDAAIKLPNLVPFGDTLYVERGSTLWDRRADIEALGYKVKEGSLASGLHGIVISYHDGGGYSLAGGADPRREGTAKGGK